MTRSITRTDRQRALDRLNMHYTGRALPAAALARAARRAAGSFALEYASRFWIALALLCWVPIVLFVRWARA